MAKQVISALYDDLSTARSAVEDLVSSGFNRDMISLVAADSTGNYARHFNRTDMVEDDLEDVTGAEGAGFGAVVGALVGLGAMAIPGIGPVIAAGPLAAALIGAGVGAAAGAVTGGIAASLIDMGVDTESATYYEEGLRRGGTLVVVHADETNADRVVSVLNSHSPSDLDTKVTEWKQTGWSGYAGSPSSTNYSSSASSTGGMSTMDSAARSARYADISTGGVRVFSVPSTTSTSTTTTHDFNSFSPYFRNHYDQTYTGSEYDYDYYIPAYEYGYRLAMDDRYQDYEWDTIESSARSNWEDHNPNTWEDIKDAVQHAWNRVRAAVM